METMVKHVVATNWTTFICLQITPRDVVYYIECERHRMGESQRVSERARIIIRKEERAYKREHKGMRVVFISRESDTVFHFNRYSNLFVCAT